MSPLIHRFELSFWSLPGTPWVLAAEALVALLLLGVLVGKAVLSTSSTVRLSWSDHRPHLLRVIQSPIHYAAWITAICLFCLHASVLQVDPRLHTWAIQGELHEDAQTPLGWADQLRGRKFKEPSKSLLLAQREWAEVWASPATQELFKLPLLAPQPLPQGSDLELAASAKQEQDTNRHREGIFALGAIGGLIAMLVLWLHEGTGGGVHGNAHWASRSQVLYHRNGYWSLPLRVLQRGNRAYAKVGSAPYTVARPARTTHVVHMIVVGHSGSGKGKSFGAHVFRTCTVPIVYFDYKAELPGYRLRPRMRRWGFAAGKPKGLPSQRFNFVAWARDHEDPDTACKALAAAILPADSQNESVNQWIKDTAIPILAQGLLDDRWRNLAELADEVEHTPLPELLNNIEVGRGRMFSMEGRNVPQYAQNELSNNTQAFLSGRARHIVSGSDFTMEDVFRKGLYVMGQAASLYEQRALKLLWAVFWFELLRKSEPLPLLVFIDEGIANGPIPNVQDALITLRDRRVSLIQCFQYQAGVDTVYGSQLGPAVVAAHQTHIWLTKGLSDPDITSLSKSLKSFTEYRKSGSGQRIPQPVPLLQEDEFKRHCRQEKHWAVIDGVGWTSGGAPILAALVEAADDSWSWTNTRDAYEAEEHRLGFGTELPSRFKMHKVNGEWRPVFPEEAAQIGIGPKPVAVPAPLEPPPAPALPPPPPASSDAFGF